jgi:hypothetical protein
MRLLGTGWGLGIVAALTGCQPRVVESYDFGVQIARPAFATEEDVKNLANTACERGLEAVFQRFHGLGRYVFSCRSK